MKFTTIIANAFSLNMIDTFCTEGITVIKCSAENVANSLSENDFKSVVGHTDTARVFSQILGMDIPANRVTFKIDPQVNTELFVGQYSGPRLPEGATELPEGASIQWFCVIIPKAKRG